MLYQEQVHQPGVHQTRMNSSAEAAAYREMQSVKRLGTTCDVVEWLVLVQGRARLTKRIK